MTSIFKLGRNTKTSSRRSDAQSNTLVADSASQAKDVSRLSSRSFGHVLSNLPGPGASSAQASRDRSLTDGAPPPPNPKPMTFSPAVMEIVEQRRRDQSPPRRELEEGRPASRSVEKRRILQRATTNPTLFQQEVEHMASDGHSDGVSETPLLSSHDKGQLREAKGRRLSAFQAQREKEFGASGASDDINFNAGRPRAATSDGSTRDQMSRPTSSLHVGVIRARDLKIPTDDPGRVMVSFEMYGESFETPHPTNSDRHAPHWDHEFDLEFPTAAPETVSLKVYLITVYQTKVLIGYVILNTPEPSRDDDVRWYTISSSQQGHKVGELEVALRSQVALDSLPEDRAFESQGTISSRDNPLDMMDVAVVKKAVAEAEARARRENCALQEEVERLRVELNSVRIRAEEREDELRMELQKASYATTKLARLENEMLRLQDERNHAVAETNMARAQVAVMENSGRMSSIPSNSTFGPSNDELISENRQLRGWLSLATAKSQSLETELRGIARRLEGVPQPPGKAGPPSVENTSTKRSPVGEWYSPNR